jgi:hypothetical protein
VVLERGPLSLVSTIEELLGRNNSISGLEIREYGRRNPPRSPRETPLSAKVVTNFADKSGRSVSIVRSQTKPTELLIIIIILLLLLLLLGET